MRAIRDLLRIFYTYIMLSAEMYKITVGMLSIETFLFTSSAKNRVLFINVSNAYWYFLRDFKTSVIVHIFRHEMNAEPPRPVVSDLADHLADHPRTTKLYFILFHSNERVEYLYVHCS